MSATPPPPSTVAAQEADRKTVAGAGGEKRKQQEQARDGDGGTSGGSSPVQQSLRENFQVEGTEVINVHSPQVSSDEESDDDKVSDLIKSRPASKEDLLERKATLDPDFIKMLTVPDNHDNGSEDQLFETNQAPVVDGGARGSSFAARKTGFESWLKTKTSAKQLYGSDNTENKVLLAFKNFSLDVADEFVCWPQSVRRNCQNFSRDCLDLGVDDETRGYPVLKGVSGVMLAGKTTLVIGPPDAGTTTLLRALSGRLNPREDVRFDFCVSEDGKVDLRNWTTRRRSAFVAADDHTHIPSLTVRETMEFAARLTMGGREGQTAEQREADLIELVQRVVESLGLSEQADTIVGDDKLRGVSGGQKRRVTLGEMLFSRDAKLLFLDDITNGLDSSKAQQVVRIIRSACRVLGFSAMVSLLQPNDMLFDAFDEVIVLSSKGEMVFNGPTPEAVPYFETLLERTTAKNVDNKDWTRPSGMASAEYILMAVTTLQEMFDKGPDLGTLPTRFLESADGSKLADKLERAEKHLLTKNETVALLQPYATSGWNQVRVLIKRKALLISRNPMTLRRIMVAIAFGLVIGTLFSTLNQDMLGALARSGFFFLSIFLVLMLSTAVTVPDNHSMRLVFYKQFGSAFHSAWAFHLSNFLCDLPLAVIEALLLSIIPYWWVSLRVSDAGGFFFFFATLLALEFVGQAASRVIAALSPTVIMAQLIASGLILCCGLVGGFMPHYKDIPPWWQWLNWVTPVGYAQEGLVVNNYVAGGAADAEFPALVVTVNGTTVSLGHLSGLNVSSAMGQPRLPFDNAPASLNNAGKVMAFDFGMLLVFAIVFDILGLGALIISHRWYEPWSRRSIQTTSAKTTLREIKEILKGVSAQFTALKREEFSAPDATEKGENAGSDPSLATGRSENTPPDQAPLLAQQPQVSLDSTLTPMTLAIIDVSYFVPDNSGKEKLPAQDSAPEASAAGAGAPPRESKERKSTLSNGAKLPPKVSSKFADVVHTEDKRMGENLQWSVDRLYTWVLMKMNIFGGKHPVKFGPKSTDRDDSDSLPAEERIQLSVHRPRSGSKRGRAWSNKLPFGEEEDPVEGAGPAGDELQLLDTVTAIFRTGEMTALMGQSGCGKTTLLDVMAGYKTGGRIKGDMFLNGNKVESKDMRRYLGYAEQMDLHMPVLSVYESLLFAATCRLPNSTSTAERERIVERVMDVLQLSEFRNIVVGQEDAAEGLAKHARKRLTIGVELVSLPRILFLDEPTTGLDSLGAEIVIGAVAEATRKLNIAVVATIHQPSRAVFGRFDRLLFMKRGGQVIYHGPISSFQPFEGEASTVPITSSERPATAHHHSKDWLAVHVVQRQPSGLQPISEDAVPSVMVADMRPAPTIADTVLAYFAGLGAPPLKQGFNPADHLLLAVETLEENGVDVADLFEESPEKKKVWEEVGAVTKQASPLPSTKPQASFGKQLGVLLWRALLSQWRDPKFTVFRFLWYALSAMFIGTVFIRLGCGIQDAVFRIAALFFAVYAAIIPMQVAVMPLVKERAVVYRETASGTYSAWADGIARLIADIPFHVVLSLVFYAIYYYAVGLSIIPERTGYFILMIFLTFWMLTSFGQATAMLSPNIETANGLAGLVILLSTFLMGFLIPSRLMPAGWRWALWINMLYYILQGLCVNELEGQWFQINFGNTTLPCGPMEILDRAELNNTARQVAPFQEANQYLRGSFADAHNPSAVDASLLDVGTCVPLFADLRQQGEALLQCMERNNCFTGDNIERCIALRCNLSFLRFTAALTAALDCLPERIRKWLIGVLPCLIQQAESHGNILTCFPRAEEILEFLNQYGEVIVHFLRQLRNSPELLSWFLYILAYQTIYIPANIILFFFEWATPADDGTGFVALTKWWYCMFAVTMFLVGWELIKILGRRYVVWVKR